MALTGVVLMAATLLAYSVASVYYVGALYDLRRAAGAERATAAGWAAQTLWLGHRAWVLQGFPAVTLYDWVTFFTWLMVGGFLALAWAGRRGDAWTPRRSHIGSFLVPVLTLLELAAQLLFTGPASPFRRYPAWLPTHIFLVTLGDAAFLLAAVAGTMYVEKERELKHKRLRVFYYELPPLEVLDAWGARLVTAGVVLFLAGMVVGAIGSKADYGSYWNWNPKETWSLVSWSAYLAYLGLRRFAGWRGYRPAVWSMVAFLLVVANVFAVSLLFPGDHAYNI
ncbi:HemX protein, negative effector of steady-state concentration of glutamyl-tRNA reductase [Candidatus Hydrogenisulfobacillus filiaventi]|uniref:HemX protein, negative effector of steady-state concentration of glutamyl-tRNA reductase n=1 Tax=Candidatus Hydrogenisulfobacillus filiaventi TaxID=2707344 RepID=A0A6F8ZFI8_9FIRM|nr:cytochrome c biogenesis protein CcsA [Bacillota bacterium]CAB1128359.1 HemX protein, negative effector of steady-state concentration of glutamyl-tRNA reductase [Candidatus Hydrogenisulfobacillus filiaventi]